MNDEQIVKYVKDMIIDNLAERGFTKDIATILTDKSNKTLLSHIKGLIELFEKAKEILESKNENN